jgi:[ribosomal protein S18]-alanine N-acetyltransferase
MVDGDGSADAAADAGQVAEAAAVAGVAIGPVRPEELEAVAALIARRQAEPEHHVGAFGDDQDGLVEQLTGLEPAGLAAVLVARRGGVVVAVLTLEWDDDPPRVWWGGPTVAAGVSFDPVADALLAAGRLLLPASVTQEELGPDVRNVAVARFAERHGFVPEEPSAVLRRTLGHAGGPGAPDPGPPVGGTAAVTIGDLDDADRAAVARLHDRLFPGTHTTGAALAGGGARLVLVARLAGDVVGYVVAEPQEDGAGYLDYLGVEPVRQGRGIGRALVEAVCDALVERHACPTVFLTVRASNHVARAVYAAAGFTEERVLQPWRRGFSLA